MSNWMKDLHNDHKKALKKIERLTDELADALKNESHYAKEIIEKDKRIEELKLEMGQWVRAVGLLTTMKPDLEIDAEHPGLMAREIFKWVAEKDKRIESLEQALAKASLRTQELENTKAVVEYMNAKGAFITTEQLASGEVVLLTQGQIDAAWDAVVVNPTDQGMRAHEVVEMLGIVACEECGGSGVLTPDGLPDRECPSCHGHGWIITSVDVDKYGRIGTGEE